MRKINTCLVLILLFTVSLVGCLSDDEEEQELNLGVSYDSLNGTIIESYSDGEIVSSNFVTIEFDFSETTSENDLSIYGVDTNDSRLPVEVDAKDTSVIKVEFTEHGIYELTLYAIDTGNKQDKNSIYRYIIIFIS